MIKPLIKQMYCFSFVMVLLAGINHTQTNAQSQASYLIKGKISDPKGEPLPGVTILIKGTSIGTASSPTGEYSLQSPQQNGTLVISFIGYTAKEVAFNGAGTHNITLTEDAKALEEVVVVGYGTQRKSDLTGSIASANIEAFRESPNVSILQSLQGSVPGVSIGQTNQAGEEASITIRGKSTLSGNESPLIVVDNIIYSGRLSDINPTDVASVQVLKDASSKAIYGAQAANGVILITTKTGKAGKKPSFTYSGSYAMSSPTVKARLLNREQYLQKVRDIEWRNSYTKESNYTEPNPAWTFANTDMNTPLDEGLQTDTDFDWYEAITQPAYISNHTIGASGGSEKTTFYLSAGYTDQKGMIKNDNYNRLALRLNLDTDITTWFKVGANLSGAFVDLSGDYPDMGRLATTAPLVQPWDANGDLIINPLADANTNLLLNATNDNYNVRDRIVGNFFGVVQIPWVKGLSFRLNQGTNLVYSKNFGSSKYGAGRTGSAFKNNAFQKEQTLDNILNYTRQLGHHSINATLVYGYNKVSTERTGTSGTGFSDLDLSYNNLGLAELRTIESSASNESALYQMARIGYNFKDKYLLTATLRRDGFSAFAANNKIALFPSLGLGWVLSEENFFNIPLIDFLKLRGSYGENGNKVSQYSSLAVIEAAAASRYVYGDGGATTFGRSVKSLANNDLRWEKTRGINAGMDFNLFKNRINGNVEYYNSNTKDLIWAMIIPQTTGFNSVLTNIGEINNKGFEFYINGSPLKTSNFTWNIGVNFSRNRNKVVSLLGQDSDDDGKEDDLVASGLFIGHPLGTRYDYEVAGIWQVGEDIPAGFQPGSYKVVDQNSDGKITAADDRVILGYGTPAYQFGIQNTLQYKQLALRFFINSIQGGKNGYLSPNHPGFQTSKGNATNSNWFNFYDYWSPSRPNAKYANGWEGSPVSGSREYFQRNFVRLQDISLSYSLPEATITNLRIKGMKVYVSGKNLLTLTKWDGWDPETGQGITSTDAFPLMKSYTLGIDLSF
jgi:TonB-dependent starch-binding outer membrane protein SusC